jgi:cytochrome c-type biogenesis protein CcmH/NrfF
MNFDISRLFELQYYTEWYPQGDFLWGFPLLVFFFALVFIHSLLAKFAPQNKYFKKSIKRRTGKFVALGILGIISVLSRFAEIPMFSMRLWLYIILFLILIFGIRTWIIVSRDYKDRLQAVDRENQKQGKR